MPTQKPGFSPNKAAAIINHLESLFPGDDEVGNAAMHLCAVLLGLTANEETAQEMLDKVAELIKIYNQSATHH